MPSIMDYAAWRRKGTVSGRAVALWKSSAYDGVRDSLFDLSGNGLHARLGSAVGADSNDPLRLQYSGKYVYFPGSASNSLSLPRPVASVDYLITYSDGTTATGNSTADPLILGTTDVKFAGLKVASIALTNASGGAVVGGMTAAALAEPYATYTDPQGNVWTLNRSASGRKLCVVDRDLLLLGTDDYLEVADSPLLNFGAGQDFTLALLMRRYGNPASAFLRYASKRAASGGYWEFLNLTNTDQAYYLNTNDGTTTVSTAVISDAVTVSGTAKLIGAGRRNGSLFVIDNGLRQGGAQAGSFSNTGVLRFGSTGPTAGSYEDMEFIGAAIFRDALSAAELVRLRQEMLA